MNSIDTEIVALNQRYKILENFRINYISDLNFVNLELQLRALHKDSYSANERIVFTVVGDCYNDQSLAGIGLQSIQTLVNTVDISNYFVEIVTTNTNIHNEYQWVLNNISSDPVPFHITICSGEYHHWIDNSVRRFTKKEQLQDQASVFGQISKHHQTLLSNKTFCILPWTHLQIEPSGKVRTCCESKEVIGNVNSTSLDVIWNSDKLAGIRKDMLEGKVIPACNACYKKEELRRESMRVSFNRQLAHRIYKVDSTRSNGTVEYFGLNYFDSRFNNLCNLACRSCHADYSSAWHDVAVSLGLKNKNQKPLLIAGKTPTDVFDQIVQNLDELDIIYFAGGEPLINEQFYEILDLLIKKGRFNTKLLYNTNLTQLFFKKKSILELWKKFKHVSVGASLDAEGRRAEYLRPGTKWNEIVNNRKQMIEICPNVDFYISATTGMINALHIPEFHKSWTTQGLIHPSDFNIQILFKPDYQSVSHAPDKLKLEIQKTYTEHLDWLRPVDHLGRASAGYESIINLINQSSTKFNAMDFWHKVNQLDCYHQTDLLEFFPELVPFVPVDQK